MTSQFKKLIPEVARSYLLWGYALIPLPLRMNRRYWKLRKFLRDAQWWDGERIQDWQLKHLREIVAYAYQHVPGYQALYREAGVKPDTLESLADIRHFPFVTKELLRDNPEEFVSRKIPTRELNYVTTGGSTGVPFGFYHTSTNLWMEKAFIHASWERVGWQFGDTSAVLRNFIGSKGHEWYYQPRYHELWFSIYNLDPGTYENYLEKLVKFEPYFIQAYPSAITVLADFIIEHRDTGRIQPRAILLGSENVYDLHKQRLSQAFPGTRVFAWYGHTEQAILAPACENTDQYHLWPFYGFTEIIGRNDEEVDCGEVGELVGTSFWNYGTPFIRYRTMDMGRKGNSVCPSCGRQHQLLQTIEGRLQDYVVTREGNCITLTALIFGQHFHAFGVIKNLQLYQDTPGIVIVKIVPTEKFTEEHLLEVKNRIENAVSYGLEARVILVDEISRTSQGKYRFLEQKLDIRHV